MICGTKSTDLLIGCIVEDLLNLLHIFENMIMWGRSAFDIQKSIIYIVTYLQKDMENYCLALSPKGRKPNNDVQLAVFW